MCCDFLVILYGHIYICVCGSKLGQLDGGMGEFYAGSKHPLSGTDAENYFDLYAVTPGYQPRGVGDCGSLAQYYHAHSGCVGLICLGRLPT